MTKYSVVVELLVDEMRPQSDGQLVDDLTLVKVDRDWEASAIEAKVMASSSYDNDGGLISLSFAVEATAPDYGSAAMVIAEAIDADRKMLWDRLSSEMMPVLHGTEEDYDSDQLSELHHMEMLASDEDDPFLPF